MRSSEELLAYFEIRLEIAQSRKELRKAAERIAPHWEIILKRLKIIESEVNQTVSHALTLARNHTMAPKLIARGAAERLIQEDVVLKKSLRTFIALAKQNLGIELIARSKPVPNRLQGAHCFTLVILLAFRNTETIETTLSREKFNEAASVYFKTNFHVIYETPLRH
ncbi:MAG: hypothetical protein KGI50_00735 [Patescibacteria group bacterium]|nr:hypothetical protein [Patescibacteria group bacterium]MDE2438121.1 hypothetical protein [Patescibacteria group bacterium]